MPAGRHLVMQGPMVSFFTNEPPQRDNPHVIRVVGRPACDTHGVIDELLGAHRELFDRVVLATWDDQPLDRALLSGHGVDVVVSPVDPLRPLPNHRKQVVGVLAGLDALADVPATDQVLKVRTDLCFDLRRFADHAREVDRAHPSWQGTGQHGFIHVNESRGPFFLGDLFMAGAHADLVRLWSSLHPSNGMSGASIHAALGWEYVLAHHRRLGVPAAALWDYLWWVAPLPVSEDRLRAGRLWRHLVTRCFSFAPSLERDAFSWRGQPSGYQTNTDRLKRLQHYGEWARIQDDPTRAYDAIDHGYWAESRRIGGPRHLAHRIRRTAAIGIRAAAAQVPGGH